MNTLVLLMALVGLSYLSGLFGRRRRAIPGLGLPTVSVWVIVGFLLGPDLLGIVDRAMQSDVEPMVHVTVGWVALVIGLDYGVVRSRRLRRGRIVVGVLLGALTVCAIAAAAWWALPYLVADLSTMDRWVFALGLGAIGSESTSNAVRWVAERNGVRGPLAELLDDLAEAKDVAPILAGGIALCLHVHFEAGPLATVPRWVIPSIVVGMGVVLGAVAAIMLAREERLDQSWGLVVGTSLLAIGTAARLRLPVMTALFFVGLVIGIASRHRDRLLALIEPTRRSALLPTLLLAGAHIGPHMLVTYAIFIALVLTVRLTMLSLIGQIVAPRGQARAAASVLGLAMLPAGDLSMTVGLSFAIICPGLVGEAVLVAAAGVTLVGEIVGPLSLRAALRRAGELVPVNDNSAEIVL